MHKIRNLRGSFVDQARFMGAFLRRPVSVGALSPSSRWLARAMVEDCALSTAEVVVELGPGTGAFTREILAEIGKQTTFFAVELSPLFTRSLRRRYPTLIVYNDSAERLLDYLARHEKTAVNHIFCGLPWASLPLDVQERVFDAIVGALAPGGTFCTFGYLHARRLPNAIRFRQRLEGHFSEVACSTPVWRNFPPAFIYRCRK